MGIPNIRRDPEIGDIGTVVHIYLAKTDDLAQAYIVECCDDEGIPYWLADFLQDELGIVESAQPLGEG